MKLATLFGLERNKTDHLEKWVSTAGGMAGMLAVVAVSSQFVDITGVVLVAGSMGSSAVLLFAVPHGPLSQPWAVLGGHAVSSVIGVACVQWIPDTLLAASAAVALAIGGMHYLRCIHPPGGATALGAVVGGESIHALGYQYVLTPIMASAVAMLLVAVVFNFAFPWRRYPASLANWYKNKNRASSHPDKRADPVSDTALESALTSMNRVIDISGHDLKEIYALARSYSRPDSIDPMQLTVGQYYSNDEADDDWQVRQIIDMASPANSTRDKLIYKVVGGKSLYHTDTQTREEFSRWASCPVLQNKDAWLRIEATDKIATQT